MKNIFNTAILAQLVFTILFIVHRFFYPLGSDFMFGMLVVSLLISCYLFWQIFKVKNILGSQKTIGLIGAFLPIIWLLVFLNFIS